MRAEELNSLYARFRDLSFQHPRQARELFCELLDTDSPYVTRLMEMASGPNDGRLRHLIANAVRPRADKSKIIHFFVRWLENETDEFAKVALKAALQGVNLSTFSPVPPPDLPDLLDTYRYVSERLCHRIRNGLIAPHTELRNLRDYAKSLPPDTPRHTIEDAIDRIQNSLRKVALVAGFDDSDELFQMRSIALCSWLEQMTERYSHEWNPIKLNFEGPLALRTSRVIACDYWLDTAFWNLWKNAEQAVEDTLCILTVNLAVVGKYLCLVLVDNGQGFSLDMQSVAFQDRFSTKGHSRGRGLLEVQDAIARLNGQIELIQANTNSLRIQIKLPMETK